MIENNMISANTNIDKTTNLVVRNTVQCKPGAKFFAANILDEKKFWRYLKRKMLVTKTVIHKVSAK